MGSAVGNRYCAESMKEAKMTELGRTVGGDKIVMNVRKERMGRTEGLTNGLGNGEKGGSGKLGALTLPNLRCS